MVFALLIILINPTSRYVVSNFPDNYEWRANQAIQSGNLESARIITKDASDRQYYDFGAQALLATVYLKQNRTTDAIHLLQTSINRTRAINGRQVYSESYDLAGTVELYVKALIANHQTVYASEMLRWWHDLETLHSPLSGSEVRHKPLPYTSSISPDDVHWLTMDQITTQSGIGLTKAGTLRFDNNGLAVATLPDSAGHVSQIVLEVKGAKVMGIGAILRVSFDGDIVADIYAEATNPRLIDLPLTNREPAGNLELTLEFLNDEFEPITSTDRYIELLRIGYVTANP